MGLDISAYAQVEKVQPFEGWTDESGDMYEAGLLPVPDESDFPEHRGSLEPGWYAYHGEEMGFRAGPYSGYNLWREQLSQAILGVPASTVWANSDHYRDRPFFELINFSDCDGQIGPEVAAELLKDFEENVKLALEQDDYFVQNYRDFHEAMKLAADNGMVVFH